MGYIISPAASAVLFAVGFALIGASAGDPCTDGSLCCRDCIVNCFGQASKCLTNCKFPCIQGQVCSDVGNLIAQSVAASACEQTKSDCGVGAVASLAATAEARQLLDLEGCCRVVRGSCSGNAANIACSEGNYGTCSEADFKIKYQNYVADGCKSTVCFDSACQSVLAGDPGC